MTLTEAYVEKSAFLDCITYSSDKEWLELRREGIGGSDAAAAMGLSKYTSPLKLYKIKKGTCVEDLSDNPYVKKGKSLEPFIRETYVRPYLSGLGYELEHPECMFVNKECPWLRANVDGIAFHKFDLDALPVIVEIKWVNEHSEGAWGGDRYCGIPVHYYAQVQHYMTVLKARGAWVCALFDSDWTMHYFWVPYDHSFAVRLLADTKEFYCENIIFNKEPEVTPHLDTTETLELVRKRKEHTVKSEDLVYDAEFDRLCADYVYAMSQIADLENLKTVLKDQLVKMHLKGIRGSGEFVVSCRERATSSFDKKRFEEDHPDVLGNYTKTSSTTVTIIRRK